MAYSYAESTASGSTAIFTVPFEYISKAYVHVSVNGVLVDDALLTWNSSTEIVLPTTPGAGATVRRYRTTPKTPLVTFQSGDLSTSDLNLFAKQCSHLVQEATDTGDSVEAALVAVSAAITASTLAAGNANAAAAAAFAAAAAAAIFDPSSYLSKSGNLAGLADKALARANLALATVASTGSYGDLAGRPTLGTASTKDFGTSAGQLVALDGGAKLPAVDGSQLVNAAGVKKRVSSGLLTPSAGGLLTWGHSLGSMPSRYWATLVCQTAELGYAVGEEIEAYGVSAPGATAGAGVSVRADGTNVTARVGNNYPAVVINGSNGSGGQTLSMANWKVRLWAEL